MPERTTYHTKLRIFPIHLPCIKHSLPDTMQASQLKQRAGEAFRSQEASVATGTSNGVPCLNQLAAADASRRSKPARRAICPPQGTGLQASSHRNGKKGKSTGRHSEQSQRTEPIGTETIN